MKPIPPPPSGIHPDRSLLCQEALADGVSDLALAAIKAGWPAAEVATALVDLADHVMLAVLANSDLEREIAALRRR